jgi:phospholipid/cholesterol/gamma-HCH transport system substrate-binding protein
MEEQSSKRLRLGIFVIAALTCLILGLYFIGSKRNIFHSKINVSAVFRNVSGLMAGNNVQFNGINVGTVTKVSAIADTSIKVEFTIDEAVVEYIHTTAMTSINTDGLLGNKLVTIAPGKTPGPPVQEGSVLKSINSIDTDKALRTLLSTNDNLNVISENLKGFSGSFSSSNSLMKLLNDSSLTKDIKSALVHIKITSERTAIITGDLSDIVKGVKSGKGTLGALITDEKMSKQLKQTVINLESVTDSFAVISGNFMDVSKNIKNGKGAIGTLISDTSFVNDLNTSMDHIKSGTQGFDENMEALHHTWPFKKYFRKKTSTKSK